MLTTMTDKCALICEYTTTMCLPPFVLALVHAGSGGLEIQNKCDASQRDLVTYLIILVSSLSCACVVLAGSGGQGGP